MPDAKKLSAMEYQALWPRALRKPSPGRSTSLNVEPLSRTMPATQSRPVRQSTPKRMPMAPPSGTV